jgi:ATP-dependent Lhr-like helicase
MQGTYTRRLHAAQWCDRSLLARIPRYTIKRLRQEIEPVTTQDFMRFLLRWQHVAPADMRQGPDALDAVIADLQGFEAPAAAWEAELLPARLADYDFTWLDDACLSGRVAWARLSAPVNPSAGVSVLRTTPIALLPRRAVASWVGVTQPPQGLAPSGRAARVADVLRTHGASFFDEIVDATRMLRTEVEEALAELVALGIATSDSFAGLRALLTPSAKRKRFAGRGRRRGALVGIDDAGRWSLSRRPPSSNDRAHGAEATQARIDAIALALLRRYGVVSWRLLAREAAWLPAWRELARTYRRLEARGEVRGGRFVASITGEQFALPDAVALLRDTRRAPCDGEFITVSAADPLNLVGTLFPGAKIAALTGNRIAYRDGVPMATLVGGEFVELSPLDVAMRRAAERALWRLAAPLPEAFVSRASD